MLADAVCRVCLVNNLNLYGVRNDLQNIYETLTREKYNAAGYPVRMCYICLSALRKCHRFMETARDANSSLKQFYNQQCQMAAAKPLSVYSVSELNTLSIDNKGIALECDIKREKLELEEQSNVDLQTDNCQMNEDVEIEVKPEIQTDDDDEIQTDNSKIYEDIEIEVKPEIETNDETQLSHTSKVPKEMNTEMKIEETHERNTDVFVFKSKKTISEMSRPKNKNKNLKSDISKSRNVTKKNLNKKSDERKTPIVEKPYSCNICNHKCARKSHLTVHMKTHATEKPFSCKICSFKSAENSQLTRHLKIHTGEKPFKCEQCNYKCAEKRNLTDHMRTHTGEKPFSCDLCDYKCSRKDNLRNHMKVHTGVKPFSCDVCYHRFAHSSNLKQHVLAKHTKQKIPKYKQI